MSDEVAEERKARLEAIEKALQIAREDFPDSWKCITAHRFINIAHNHYCSEGGDSHRIKFN